MKYLGPWANYNNTTYVRYDLYDKGKLFQVWEIQHPNERGWIYHGKGKCFDTKELAMEAVDKILTDEGYIFLTQEQFNKLQVLL